VNVNWSALLEVFIVALVVGAGTIALFSLGIVALDRRAAATTDRRPVAVPTALSALCFLACAAVVGFGIYLVISH
jgi:uncharacterized membrane protein YedE/YeeE